VDIKFISLEESQIKPIPSSDFGFGQLMTNRMFTQYYNPDKGWHGATVGPYKPFELDPATAVFHYGQEIFEGAKAYRRPDGGVNLFRPWENARRFNKSAERMAMPIVDPEEHLTALVQLVDMERDWVPSVPGSALYIRPTMIATDSALGVRASSTYIHFVILSPVGSYFKEGFNPVSVFVSDDYRRAVKGGTGEAKAGGNYAGSLLAAAVAKKQGYSQVLWLDAIEGRYVEEVGAMNICFVLEGQKIVTPTLSGSILPGITRDSVIRLGRDLGYEVAEEKIDIEELLTGIESGRVTEIFGCGTAAVIAPVGRLGFRGKDYEVNNYEVGPVASHLYHELTGIQTGRIEDRFDWTMQVTSSDF